MAIIEQAKSIVTVDDQQAEQAMQKLQQEAAAVRKELMELKKQDLVDPNKLAAAEKKLKSVNSQMRSMKQDTFDTVKVLKNLNGASLNDLYKAEKQLRNETRALSRDTQEYANKSKQLKQVREEIRKVNAETGRGTKFMSMLKQALPVVSISALVFGLGQLGKEMFNLAKQMQGENVRASTVFGDELGYVQEQADKVAKKMGVTNHEFITMAAATADLLIPLDFTRKASAEMSVQLQELTGALDEWTAGSIGAEEISQILTKAMLGENEQLKRLGIAIRKDSEEFRTLVKQKMEAERVTKAQAEAMATLELIQKKSLDAQAAYNKEGNKLLRWQKEAGRQWRQLKENVIGWFEIDSVDKIKQEQLQFNILASRLTDTNLKEEDRVKVINQLNSINPEFLKGLDIENLQLDELKRRLIEVNQQYVNRIVLQEKQKEIDKEANKAADIKLKQIDRENELREIISKTAIKLNASEQILGKTYQEQFDILSEIAAEQGKMHLMYEQYGTDIISLQARIDGINTLNKNYNTQLDLANELTARRIELEKELGITLDEKSKGEDGLTTGSIAQTEAEKKALEEKEKILARIRELEHQYTVSQMSEAKQAEQAIIDKYNNEIAKAQEAGLAKEEIDKLYNLKNQELSDLYLEQFVTFLNKETDLLIAEQEKRLSAEEKYIADVIAAEAEKQTKLKQKEAKELADYKDYLHEKQDAAREMASFITDLLFKALEDGKITTQEMLKIITLSLLRGLKNTLIAAITKVTIDSFATIDSILSFGLTGAIRAGILIGLIEAAYQGIESKMMRNVNQRYKGKYPVRGADDGRQYWADYYGPVDDSGIFTKPTLIAERGPEMIISGPHLENMNRLDPGLISQIMSYHIPQRAEGSYPIISTQQPTSNIQEQTNQMNTTIERLNSILDRLQSRPIKSYIVRSELQDYDDLDNQIQSYASGN